MWPFFPLLLCLSYVCTPSFKFLGQLLAFGIIYFVWFQLLIWRKRLNMDANVSKIQQQLTELEIEAEHLLLARHQVNFLNVLINLVWNMNTFDGLGFLSLKFGRVYKLLSHFNLYQFSVRIWVLFSILFLIEVPTFAWLLMKMCIQLF